MMREQIHLVSLDLGLESIRVRNNSEFLKLIVLNENSKYTIKIMQRKLWSNTLKLLALNVKRWCLRWQSRCLATIPFVPHSPILQCDFFLLYWWNDPVHVIYRFPSSLRIFYHLARCRSRIRASYLHRTPHHTSVHQATSTPHEHATCSFSIHLHTFCHQAIRIFLLRRWSYISIRLRI